MRWRAKVLLRLRSIFRRADVERDLEEEVRFHVDQQALLNQAAGMEERAAREAAMREFGGLEQTKEECRDMRSVTWLADFVQDVRYGLRTLRKDWAFAAVAAITLALGIGANTAIFSVVNGVLLRPLPFPQPQYIYTIGSNQSLADLTDIQARSRSYEALGGMNTMALDFTGGEEPEQIRGGLCNSGFFPALDVQPFLGRAISSEEDVLGGVRVVVLSYGFWQRRFAGDKSIIGKFIPLSGNSYQVIGVMPESFWIPEGRVDALISLRVGYPEAARARGAHLLRTFLRLKPGVSVAQAQQELDSVGSWLAENYPDEDTGRIRTLIPLQESVVGDVRPALLILSGAVGLLLLVTCVNFASLLLTRASNRKKEMAVRAALGAGKSRLIRQMLAEGWILALLGGGLAIGLAQAGIRLLVALKPPDLPRLTAIRIDGNVLLFALGIALVTGLIFGLIPALHATRSDVNEGLKASGRSATDDGSSLRLRRILVASEIALALVLLAGAGLLIRSFRAIAGVDPGFRTAGILTMRLELPAARYAGLPSQRTFRRQLLESVGELPGTQAAMTSELPMSEGGLTHNFVIDGRPALVPGAEPEVYVRTVSPGYFQVLGIPLARGREFGSADQYGTPHVVLVNQRFADTYFEKQEPLGARVAWARDTQRDWMTIVGVVGNIRQFGAGEPEQPAIYDLYRQTSQPWKRWMYLTIRSGIPPAALNAAVKKRIWAIDKQIPETDVRTMDEVVAGSLDPRKFSLTMLSVFAVVALILAAVGVYGVMSFAVRRQTHEIGIRMAMGAERGQVLMQVLKQGFHLVVAGGLAGIMAALALTRVLEKMLFGISAHDPVTLAAVAVILALVALLACWAPAWQATRVDPLVALRHE